MTSTPLPRRPLVKPALARLWRGPGLLQFGVNPGRARLLRGLTPEAVQLIALCDGTRTLDEVVSAATDGGLPAERADALLAALTRAGVLDDAAADTSALRGLTPAERLRLTAEHAALTLLIDRPGGAMHVLAQRRSQWVDVRGESSLGVLVAATLAAAGVGRVTVPGRRPVAETDVLPGGLLLDDVGRPWSAAAGDAVRRAGAGVRIDPPRAHRPPTLRVLAPRGLVDPVAALEAGADGVPVLAAHARELTGIVGPLAVPGETTCLRCCDLHRADRDPQWPHAVAQLTGAPPVPAQPVTLLTAVAAIAAHQALGHLAGDAVATVDGTLETTAGDWRLQRRPWSPHPECGCYWPLADETG